METTNKTTEHGVHNSKIHDNAAKIVFGDSTLCAQFLKGYTDIPFFMNIKPEDIEDVSSHFIPLFQESRDSDIVKKIQLENTELYLIALIEHQSEAGADTSFRLLRYMVYVWTDYMDKMDHNAHSVYLMYYHLIMVVKYRRKVIDDSISERAKEIWERIAPDYGITLEEWNHDVDHVHVMFRAQPKSELSKFINAYKSASSRLLKKEYPQIRERLWKEAFWSQSFCLLTAGGAPIDVICNYISWESIPQLI